MASYGPVLTRELKACLSNKERVTELCGALEQFLGELLRQHPKGNGHSHVDGILPDEVDISPDSLSIRGRTVLGDGTRQHIEPFSGDLHRSGSYSFVLGKPPLILASPGAYPLVSRVNPMIARDLESGLREEGEPDLADRVAGLRYFGPCACDLADCESFYTAPQPDGAYGEGHRNLTFVPRRGSMLVIDVVGKDIMFVEVLAL